MNTLKVNGEVLNYDCHGEGSPLILLLPQSTAPSGYDELLGHLSKKHRVIRYDPREIADRVVGPKSGSIESQADAVAEFLQVLNIGPVSVLGYSTGCGVSIALAATRPEQVTKMALISPWTHGDIHLKGIQNLRINVARQLPAEHYAHLNASLLFSPEYRHANQSGFVELVKQTIAQPPDADLIERRLVAILAFDARPLLVNIKCDTFVVNATDDQLMPCWFGREIHAGIRSCEILEFDSGGHMLLDTRRDEIASKLLGFFS